MAGETVTAGPFIGGLNTQGDEGAINDDELVVCQNFEVELDGSLRSRAPFVSRGLSWVANARILGYYTDAAGGTFPIAAAGTVTYALVGNVWTTITNTFAAIAVQQFNNKLYLLSNGAASGGTWDGTTFVADSTMPKGLSIASFKGRLWVSDSTQVRYSAVVVDSNFWTQGGTYGGSFKVGGGDGQMNVKLMLAYGNLLIFRSRSIWSFSYSTDPAYGDQSQLVGGVGLSSQDSIEMFEGLIYFMYEGSAYVLNGANATQLNTQVPFVSVNRVGCYLPFSVSVLNRKVIFSFYDVAYVWNLRSRTWSTWTTPAFTGIGKFIPFQGALTNDAMSYIGHSNYTRGTQPTLFFTDAYSTESEPVPYDSVALTKTYDYATPDHFKRLFWWGADMLARVPVTGTLRPVVYATQVTWGQIRQGTWGQLLQRTWGSPATPSYDAAYTVAAQGINRVFFRFAKSLRFRRIRYQIKVTSTGSSTTGPNKLFGIETVVSVKQLVPRQVS